MGRILLNSKENCYWQIILTVHLNFWVPQGTCAGPVIFNMYISSLKKIAQK